MKRFKFYTEICYLLGLLLPAIGGALMEKANFGLSMIIAPSYILHCKLTELSSFFTFGVCCYLFQGTLLLVMCLVLRRFRVSFLFSFVTAVVFGYTLDGATFLFSFVDTSLLWARLLLFVFGLLISAAGIAFMLHTYIASEVYELLVKEFSRHFGFSLGRCKLVYDYFSLALALLLSFLFFRSLVGIGWGTIVCTVLNGILIGAFSKLILRYLELKDALPLRRFFES